MDKTVRILVLMGSESDLPVMEGALRVIEEMGHSCELRICSAHRMPDVTMEYAKSARQRGIEVIICGAGMAAHLAGVVASYTTVPVIGVPLSSGALGGVDSLYSTVQMPTGIPVATVAINGAKNAAYLALEILSIKYPDIANQLALHRENMKSQLLSKSEELEKRYKT
ncbi:MAG: 5-(carboxyamino)imidazole ribonucleotide mutase [Candidatus Magnetoovum sp. WYHC-5]|nr:5-(carboxyamino)imidazole ribonucleotide mutase [Candidatus Magnetoovum sp. WYHC-5]